MLLVNMNNSYSDKNYGFMWGVIDNDEFKIIYDIKNESGLTELQIKEVIDVFFNLNSKFRDKYYFYVYKENYSNNKLSDNIAKFPFIWVKIDNKEFANIILDLLYD